MADSSKVTLRSTVSRPVVYEEVDANFGELINTIDDTNAHLVDTEAHASGDITNVPAGNISSTNVQDALNELDAEAKTRAAEAFNTFGLGIESTPYLSNLDSAKKAGFYSYGNVPNAPLPSIGVVFVGNYAGGAATQLAVDRATQRMFVRTQTSSSPVVWSAWNENATVDDLVDAVATQTETDSGNNDTKFITPKKLAGSVLNTLASSTTSRALSAAKGKELNDNKVDKTTILPNNTNLNTVLVTGFYRVNPGATNMPPEAGVYGQLIVSKTADTVAQIYIDHTAGRSYTRGCALGGSWSSWNKYATVSELNAGLNTKVAKTSISSGTGYPSGGSHGDIYFRY